MVTHGDSLMVGETELRLHIHPGTDTCNDCEPGQVQAQQLIHDGDDEGKDLVLTVKTNTFHETGRWPFPPLCPIHLFHSLVWFSFIQPHVHFSSYYCSFTWLIKCITNLIFTLVSHFHLCTFLSHIILDFFAFIVIWYIIWSTHTTKAFSPTFTLFYVQRDPDKPKKGLSHLACMVCQWLILLCLRGLCWLLLPVWIGSLIVHILWSVEYSVRGCLSHSLVFVYIWGRD